jgi:threonine synthase
MKADPPDWVFYPVGGGDNIFAGWKGFKEFERLDLAGKPPKLVGVQASACASLSEPLLHGHEQIRTIKDPHTIASSINLGHLPTGLGALRAIRESKGVAIGVTDKEMLEAQSLLAAHEGIFAEPASASVVAAAKRMLDEGTVSRDDKVVCVITGTGLKETDAVRGRYIVSRAVSPTIEGIVSSIDGQHGG